MSLQPESEGGASRQINLGHIANQFMGGLQRHFDMLAFNLAARERAQEVDFDRISQALGIQPVPQAHRNFEQTQAFAQDLLIRQVVGDSINLGVAGLQNAHLFLALAKANRELPGNNPEIQKQAQESQQTFVRASLDEKFNRLEKEYDIRCELEDTLLSLGFLAQNFMRQKTVVESHQLDDKGELVIELKTVDPSAMVHPEVPPLQMPMIEERKVFREGDSVQFTDRELQMLLITIGSFAHNLFTSVARYARGDVGE